MLHIRSIVLFLAVATAAAAIPAGVSWAAVSQPEIQNVTVGFDGIYKTGYWNSVRIQVTGGEQQVQGTLSITVLDGDGVPVRYTWGEDDPVVIPAKSTTTLQREVKFGQRSGRIRVAFAGSGEQGVTLSKDIELGAPLASDRELILSWGPSIGLTEALGRRSRSTAQPTAVHALPAAEQLPASWLGYNAVDTMVITTSAAQPIDDMTDRQVAALQEWLRFGGRLILCVGSRGEELLGPGGKFTQFAPGAFQQVSNLRNASPLETYSGTSRLNLDATPGGIPMTVLQNTHGKVELFDLAAAGQRPMVVRSPFGLGQVVFVAFDLDRPPFDQWEGRPRFVNRLLRESVERTDMTQSFTPSGKVAQFGYKDISGQLRSALDQFRGLTLVDFSWVAGLLLVYVLLIGPADYFLLRDVLKRLQWTWLSFPLFVAGFVALALVLNTRLKNPTVQVNQLDLVDVDEATSTLRGSSWAHLYSPDSTMYDLDLRLVSGTLPPAQSLSNLFSWHGLPGAALGGLDTATAAGPAPSSAYQLTFLKDGSTRLAGVPLSVASTKSFVSRWWGNAELTQRAKLAADQDGLLRGEIVNPLGVELLDCTVFYENWVYRLDSRRGVLAPGERTRIEVESALNLQWRLSGRRVVDAKDVSTPWDQNTLDVYKVLEMLMLHNAAGGETYTQLTNRYQPFVDLSNHLRTGRAILLGRARVPATEMLLNGEPLPSSQTQHWTYFRIVFPVQPYAP